MNIETNSGQNMNDPAVLDERIASVVNTLITVADPRLVVNALLGNAAALSQVILFHEKANHAQVASAFSRNMIDALSPRQEAKEEPRIEVVPAGVIDLSKRR